MPEWELTDDEIETATDSAFVKIPGGLLPSEVSPSHFAYNLAQHRAIAKAAQRKLVEYLEKNEDKGGFKEMFFVCIPRDIWKELRKGVGLD